MKKETKDEIILWTIVIVTLVIFGSIALFSDTRM